MMMNEDEGMSLIVKTLTRSLFPIMVLFGAYVILHGHVTPGGGFPGGVIVATGVVMMLLAYGADKAKQIVNVNQTTILESLGALTLAVLGLLGIVMVGQFLEGVLGVGFLGTIFSGSNLAILNIGVGVKVAAGLITITYAMLELEGGH